MTEPQDVVELFIGAILVTVLAFVAITVWNPSLGQFLMTFLPSIINVLVFALIIAVFGAMVYQILNAV